MKKLLAIIVLSLFWCNVGFAISQEDAIKQYLSDRKLDLIEGVWASENGNITLITKSGSGYQSIRIKHWHEPSGAYAGSLEKGSNNYYYGESFVYYGEEGKKVKRRNCDLTVIVKNHEGIWKCKPKSRKPVSSTLLRLWPENIKSHNAKYEGDETDENSAQVRASSGTAFFVTQKGHLITNYHVVKGCKNKSKIIYEDVDYNVKLIAKDKYLDLALLKADLDNEYYISISNKSPKKLQRIIAAGYPLGKELSDDLKFTSGIISSLKGLQDDSTRIQIDAALNHGNSGGPIVDEQSGKLVAVAVSGLNKEITESINFGIKAGSVKNFLDSNQINLDLNSQKLSAENDLATLLENATVYTYCK